jgi:chromosome segregation ATPase
MSGSRSRRRRKRSAAATRDGKPAATRIAQDPVRRRAVSAAPPAIVAKDSREADPAALRSEIRALKKALALAEEKANDADAKRSRAVSRATATLRRENESLEAHLTLLVQEIGQIKHLIDRVPRLEADLRTRDLQLAEREQAWNAERARLEAEIEKLGGRAGRVVASVPPPARAAAAAAGAGRVESAR